jgi:hypothetical protein
MSGPSKYEIRLKYHLDDCWSHQFADMSLTTGFDGDGSPITVLSGNLIDQAELHGILARIRDLSMTIISVNRIS